jgi:hypothetical protein
MKCTEILKARVSADIKVQAKAVADRELMTEAAWLKRLVIRELRAADEGACRGVARERPCRGGRVSDGLKGQSRPVLVRLRPDDRALLEARAEARGMRSATYLSWLTRAHLRRLAPLPQEEMRTLKRSIGELAAIGRNVNQIARAVHEGKVPASVREEFRAILKICEALRDNTKALIRTNVASWEAGHEQADL